MNHQRVNGKSLEERVWRYLRRINAPLAPREVARALRITLPAASHALRRLRDKKAAKPSGGMTHRTFYIATAVAPEDMRGTAPGTIRNLLKHKAPAFRGFHAR